MISIRYLQKIRYIFLFLIFFLNEKEDVLKKELIINFSNLLFLMNETNQGLIFPP